MRKSERLATLRREVTASGMPVQLSGHALEEFYQSLSLGKWAPTKISAAPQTYRRVLHFLLDQYTNEDLVVWDGAIRFDTFHDVS